eukprot:CAMPEP_0113943470 /NCGR_PEP_ID=MMETSP1339-20121228/24671_1 /TAXON_ID=94617 /ORGANISM="Fibrocapsa japonica" /LENGTH=255 /DNA_ID=CAMNT_0000948351 /DNA_START=125 /DNA_END=892 /DNA_ORIENTATION=+ /assembly_acc=CAM_ASM_000762
MDSWEDDEFDVPTFNINGPGAAPTSWEDEEEEDEPVTVAKVVPVDPSEMTEKQKKRQEKKEAEAKRKAEEAAARENVELELAIQANETADERKLRERRQVEEADHHLTDDLFSGIDDKPRTNGVATTSGKGKTKMTAADIETMTMSTIQDHLAVAIQLGNKLSKSQGHHALAFFKEVIKKGEEPLSVDDVGEMIAVLNVIKNDKVKAQKGKKKGAMKKATKTDKATKAKHTDTFGGDWDGADQYDNYADAYDDFM